MAQITNPREEGDVWAKLRQFTPARIGLGRAGSSLPTQALLEFELAHARARDAVHAGFDAEALARQLREAGFGAALTVTSQARNRMEYLLRPDLGRRLDEESRRKIEAAGEDSRHSTSGQTLASAVRFAAFADSLRPGYGALEQSRGLAVVIGDGLSAMAPMRHAVAVLREFFESVSFPGNVTVVVANGARVALGDEIGELLGADAVVVLIGERPGLSSPDSLGIYMTWAPRVGRTDAERNCISNVRPEGLPYADAVRRLRYLLGEARRLQLSGVALKDDSGDLENRPAISDKAVS